MRGGRRLIGATGITGCIHALAVLSILGQIGLTRRLFRDPIGLVPLKGAAALAGVWIAGWFVFRRVLGPASIGRPRARWTVVAGLAAYPVASLARVFLSADVTTSLKFGLVVSILPPLVVGAVLALPGATASRPSQIAISPDERAALKAASRRFRRSIGEATLVGSMVNLAIIGVGRLVLLWAIEGRSTERAAPWVHPAIVAVSYAVGLLAALSVLWSTHRELADRFERLWTSVVIAGLASVAALSFYPYMTHAGTAELVTWLVAALVGPAALIGITFAIGGPPSTISTGLPGAAQ
jgi:hypothetical protein